MAKESFGIDFFHIFGRGIYGWNAFWRGMIFSSEETKNTTKKTTHAETMPFHCFPCQPNSARRFFTFWALSCAGFARGSTSRASCPKLALFSGKMVEGMNTMIDNWLQDMILSDEKWITCYTYTIHQMADFPSIFCMRSMSFLSIA